ncbi:MAG: lysophospholipid acyltransferase family protein [Candidatus Neomarinimicrobiota bacterium]
MLQLLISGYRWILGLIVFSIGAPLLILTTFFPPVWLRFRVASWFARAILFTLGAKLKVEGQFPTDRTYIFMANHASFADPFILAAVMQGTFTGVMAYESERYPIWGALSRRFRAITIHRQDRASAIASIDIAEQRLQDGVTVIILPEGTRTLTGKLGPLKKGGFHMAINTKAPIQIVGIEGAFRFKRKTSRLLRPGPIIVRFGKVIPPERYLDQSMEQIMDTVRQELLMLSGEEPAG